MAANKRPGAIAYEPRCTGFSFWGMMMGELKNENITVYETYFGTPEEMAMYIVDNCPVDCYECLMPSDIPCIGHFGIMIDEAEEYYSKILNWLNSSKGSNHER